MGGEMQATEVVVVEKFGNVDIYIFSHVVYRLHAKSFFKFHSIYLEVV